MTKISFARKLKIFWELNNDNQNKLTNVLNFKQWIILNYIRVLIWLVPFTVFGILLSVFAALFWNKYSSVLKWVLWLIPFAMGLLGALFGFRAQGYLRYIQLKYNERYPKIIENGSSFFLQDVRWPWKSDTSWYKEAIPRYYHLPEADWVIASHKVKNIDDKRINDYLKTLCAIFKFNEEHSVWNEKRYKGLLILLKRLSSFNEIFAASMSYTKNKLNMSQSTFRGIVKWFMNKYKATYPLIETETLPKMPNALNSTPSGGGKTTGVVYNQLIQNALAMEKGSMFITDPKGELLQNTGNWLKIMGYDVYSFNLKDLHLSQGWNPLSDVYEDILIKGYLTQLLASYQKHNLDTYSQLSIIYNDDINIIDVPNLEEMRAKIENDSEYKSDMFKIYLSLEELKSTKLNAKCSQHIKEEYLKCACEKEKDFFIEYGNVLYAGLENIQLLYLTILPSLISSKVNQVINAIMGESSKGDNAFWDENAKSLFECAIWVFLEQKDFNVFSKQITKENLNLYSVYRFTIDRTNFNPNTLGLDYKEGEGQGAELKPGYLSTLSNSKKDTYIKLYATTKNSYVVGGKVIQQPEKTRTIIEGVVASKLKAITNEGAKYATSFNELDFNKIVKSSKPYAIFLGVELQDDTYHKLATLFITMLYQKLTWWAEKQPDLKLPRPFNFILDEVGNLPAIPQLAQKLTLSRSYRIMLLLVIQSIDQLKKSYERDVDTIIENCKYKIIRGADDFNTAKRWSDTLGNTSIKKANENYNKQRQLITPDEIMDLDYAQRHQTLYFATIYNPNAKNFYDKSSSKQTNILISQSLLAGNYKFIQNELPWYLLYNAKKFNALGAIKVLPKRYLDYERNINYDELNLKDVPSYDYSNKEKEKSDEDMFNELSDDLIDAKETYEDEFDFFDNYDKSSKNLEELEKDIIDNQEQSSKDDRENYTNAFILEKDIISNVEPIEEEDKGLYQSLSFNDFAKLYKEVDEDELKKHWYIIDRNDKELNRDLDLLLNNEYNKAKTNDLETLLKEFSENINLKRFNLMLSQLVETNNIFIDENEYIGSTQEYNVKYINSVIRKIITWLLFAKNSFTNENIFSDKINEFMITKHSERERQFISNVEFKNLNDIVNNLIKFLIKDIEFRKQFIIEFSNENKLEVSWEDYLRKDFKKKSEFWPTDWTNILYKMLFKKEEKLSKGETNE